MRCPRCHAECPEALRFCEDCGARLVETCAECGAEVTAGKPFCGRCGAPVPGRPAVRPRAPASYVPSHLAEKILTSRFALEGERKLVTVLFADLKGSMELLADRDPEEARKLLDPVLERMMEAVHRYEGTVNQVMGDGIMALFGAPLAHEDHAVRACYAALDMQAAIRRHAEETRRIHGVALAIRVGLNSGEVVVRAIGSDLRMDYTAVGQTTHLAARMEQLATPGSTLLTADTLRLAEDYVAVKPLGPVPIKGLEVTVPVYEMTGAGPRRSRLQAASSRGLTRFVGREEELEQLRQALGRAAAGRGQVVAIAGEPGVGKSRLVWEITHSHRTHGWLILESRSVSYGRATPYLPVIDLLKAYFQLEPRDDPRKIREKLIGKLVGLDRTLEATLPAFLTLLDVPVEDAQWQELDPPRRRQRTLEAVKRTLLRECHAQPLLLVFEDLHWIDGETQAFLDDLVESLPAARVLLLVSYRPEYAHDWGDKRHFLQLRLEPLSTESAEEFLEALLGRDAGLRPLRSSLIEQTAGNPFFLEECVRTLVETQVLVGERGAYRLVGSLPSIHVPATVQAVLAARMDRLPPDAKRLLQEGSVIGKDLPFSLLRAISDRSEDELRRALAHLEAAEFLYETGVFPELEYTFKHALTHEVAFGSLLQERRRALHVRIVDALEGLYPDRLAEHVDRLAHHAFCGELWDKAATYLRQAGMKSAGRSAYREAVGWFESALQAIACLPESREALERAIDLRFELRNSLLPLGEVARDLDHLRGAVPRAQAIGDQRRFGWLSAYMARDLSLLGDQHGALESGTRALDLASALGDLDLQVLTTAYLGSARHALGHYPVAADLFRRSVASLEGESPHRHLGLPGPAAVFFRIWLVWSLAKLGEFAEGIARGEEAIRIAETVDQPLVLTVSHYSLGFLYVHQGVLERAIPLLQRSLDLCRSWNLAAWFPNIGSSLGYARALSGDVAGGLGLLEQAVEQASALKVVVNHAGELAWLGEAYLLAGHATTAAETARRALDLARHHEERGNEAAALRVLADVTARPPASAVRDAQELYRDALVLADELEMRPLVADCHLGLGQLLRLAGEMPRADSHLAAARTLFHDMGMTRRAEETETEVARADPL